MSHRSIDARGPQGLRRLQESPWARVDRVQLIRREVREVLAPSALEVLLAHAERVVEGGDEVGAPAPRAGTRRVYATLMVTIDLRRCARFFREPADAATAERVAELMESSPDLERKLVRLVRAELARLAGAEPDAIEITLERTIRAEGSILYIDGDAMTTITAAGRGKSAGRG